MPSEWPLVSAKAGTASGGAPAPNTFSNSGERIGESAGQTSGLATSASMNETGGACVALGRSSKLELRLWLSFFHGRWLRQQQSGAHRAPPYPYCDYQYPYRDYPYRYRDYPYPYRDYPYPYRDYRYRAPPLVLASERGIVASGGVVCGVWSACTPRLGGTHACAHVRYEVIGIWPLPRCG
jgi:hypothetical protein